MSDAKKTPLILKDIGSPNELIGAVESLLAKSDPQELIYIQLDPSKYPNRLNDLPMDVRKYLMTHPRVKVEWFENNLALDDNHKILDYKCLYGWDVIVSLTTFPSRMKCPELL